ncbi:MAG: hypothetical protein WKF93_12510, partial [Acidimicrobiales bacterium]
MVAAAGAGAAVGCAMEHRRAGVVATVVALAAVVARPHARRRPAGVALAAGAAAFAAFSTRRLWPVPPPGGAEVVPRRLPDPERRPLADGTGLRLVVN